MAACRPPGPALVLRKGVGASGWRVAFEAYARQRQGHEDYSSVAADRWRNRLLGVPPGPEVYRPCVTIASNRTRRKSIKASGSMSILEMTGPLCQPIDQLEETAPNRLH